MELKLARIAVSCQLSAVSYQLKTLTFCIKDDNIFFTAKSSSQNSSPAVAALFHSVPVRKERRKSRRPRSRLRVIPLVGQCALIHPASATAGSFSHVARSRRPGIEMRFLPREIHSAAERRALVVCRWRVLPTHLPMSQRASHLA